MNSRAAWHPRTAGLALLAVISAVLCACSGNARTRQLQRDRDAERDVAEAASLMTGHFTSIEQSKRDPEFHDIHLHVVPIWPDQSGPTRRWLYVEQTMAQAVDKPYRQRIHRITNGSLPSTVVSEVFELPGGSDGAVRYAGLWRAPQGFERLNPAQLVKREGCEAHLRRIRPHTFEGGTEGFMCESTQQGVRYVTSQVTLDKSGLTTWDRGFDESGKQVSGAAKGGYEFKRIVE